jgi:hypothetical protein
MMNGIHTLILPETLDQNLKNRVLDVRILGGALLRLGRCGAKVGRRAREISHCEHERNHWRTRITYRYLFARTHQRLIERDAPTNRGRMERI